MIIVVVVYGQGKVSEETAFRAFEETARSECVYSTDMCS